MVLSSLVPRLFDQIRIFTPFDFPVEIKDFKHARGNVNFSLNFVESQTFLWKIVDQITILINFIGRFLK